MRSMEVELTEALHSTLLLLTATSPHLPLTFITGLMSELHLHPWFTQATQMTSDTLQQTRPSTCRPTVAGQLI